MGDLRNKWRKYEREDRIAADLAAQFARDAQRRPPPTCSCGLTWHQTQLVEVGGDRWAPRALYCQACAPDPVLAVMWPTAENDAMCNDYAREIEAAKLIQALQEMPEAPPFAWAGGKTPNDIAPQPHVRIHDNGFTLRLVDDKLEGAMTRWAWEQGKRPVYNFRSDGRDFSASERCLIAATAFYEYTEPAPAKPKVKLKDQHRFTMKGAEFFWIAGIVKQGCFAMLTTEPGPDVRPYHERQIVVLPPADGMAWLAEPKAEMLAPAPKGTLRHQQTRRGGVDLAAG